MSEAPVLIEPLPQHRIDEAALFKRLTAELPDFHGPASLRQFQGGQSNPTYLIETPTKRFVLRKKPPGVLLPSAHQIEREFRILTALKDTPVPVPPARLLCEDAEVIGTPFYVMDHVDGRVLTDTTLADEPREARAPTYQALAQNLAALHAVDFRAVGLGDFGRPEVIAVLDWELATLGHPLSDLAYAAIPFHLPPDAALPGLEGVDLAAAGLPSEADFLEAYRVAAGRPDLPHWPFFLALSLFRLTGIAQGVYARALAGNAADGRALGFGNMAKCTAEAGWRIAQNAR
jgi:aminoglycoside phosphotransferase (APT) family kinase protein